MEDDRFKYSNFSEVFGELRSVHRVRRGLFQAVVIPAILFLLVLFGVIIYVASEDWMTIPVCVAPFLVLFVITVRHLYATRRDELKIYKNGFTYKSGQNLQACLWPEIKFRHWRERNEREMAEPENFEYPLGSVEKKNGEIIEFDHDLPGTEKIRIG